jgi:hypothetical protein
LKSVIEKIIEALRENEKEINNRLHQKIEIRVADGKVQVIRQEVILKVK